MEDCGFDREKNHVRENVIESNQNSSKIPNNLREDLKIPHVELSVNTTLPVSHIEYEHLPCYPIEEIAPLLVIPSTINGLSCKALIDSGAAGNFISTSFVHQLGCTQHPLHYPTTVRVANGEIMPITHFARLIIHMEKFSIRLCLHITKMPNDLILGYPFLTRFTPRIDWRARIMHIKQGKRMYIIPGLQLHEKHLESSSYLPQVSTPETSYIYNIIHNMTPSMMNEKVSSFTYLHPVDLTPTEKDEIIQATETIHFCS